MNAEVDIIHKTKQLKGVIRNVNRSEMLRLWVNEMILDRSG